MRMRDEYRASRAWYIVEAALEYFVSILVAGAYLARITRALGFSDSLTGILSSFVSLGCLVQLASHRVLPARSVKRPILIIKAVSQLLFSLVYLTPVIPLSQGQKTVLFLVSFCGAYILSNLIVPQKTSWLMGLVDDKARGRFTADKEIASLMGGMLFTYVMGRIIDALEAAGRQRDAFLVGCASIVLLTVLHAVSLMLIKEKPLAPAPAGEKGAGLAAVLRRPDIKRVLLVGVLWSVASHCSTPFYGAYQIHELGFSMTFISVLSILYSLVRVAFSRPLGRYADQHSFARMSFLCFLVAGVSFLFHAFTMPENGKVFYAISHCLYAIAMAGINSSITNLVFDCAVGPIRRSALAVNAALSGVTGFLATCAMSPAVDAIQAAGNRMLGMRVYPAQFCSLVAFAVTLLLALYVKAAVIPHPTDRKENAK